MVAGRRRVPTGIQALARALIRPSKVPRILGVGALLLGAPKLTLP